MSFDPRHLQDIIACPKTKAKLVCDGDFLVSVDPATRLRYPIKDGIPVMLVDEAAEVSQNEWAEIMQRHNRNPETGESVS
ncbi:Trm112 family protein [uncultured Gimesia sp.]|uniref:Trm112 family protein n=1 Tax=uncultured Gimesia sp. TaxID=1678688 RepID=UPI0026036CF5|nr:Trm112 family protein [uncultured Gimesia sp.]